MENSILFGIVCFREKYWETASFRSLLSSYKASSCSRKLTIYIFDNTDIPDWNISKTDFKDEDVCLFYKHDCSNPGISVAMNHFSKYACDNKFDWIVFLDQDTCLPIPFYKIYLSEAISNNSKKIAFPKVYSEKKLISPCKYVSYRAQLLNLGTENIIKLEQISAINSGLMIKTELLLQEGGYNKNIRLDFCDHEFIERLNGRNMYADVLDVCLEQNFSAETNDINKAKARYRMYVEDMKAYRRNKNLFLFLIRVDLPHFLKLSYKYKSVDFFKIRIFNK